MREINEPGLSTVISERFALSLGQVDLNYEWHNTGKGTQASKTDISDGERLDPPARTVWITSGMAFGFRESGTRFKVDELAHFPGTSTEIRISPEGDDDLAPDSYSVESFVQKLRSGGVVPAYVLDDDYADLLDSVDKGTVLVLDYLNEEGDVDGATIEVTGVEFYPGAGKSGDEWILYGDDHSREEGFQVHVREFGEDYVTGYGRLRSMRTPEDIRREAAKENDEDRLRTDGGEDEWNPQPASLREGEHPDVSSHTQANLAAIREHERRGDMEEGAFETAAERHGLDAEEARDLLDEEDHGA